MEDTDEIPESEDMDIIDEFDNTPEGDLRQSTQEENLNNNDFDYQQGFDNNNNNYPLSPVKDSITKFYRDIISKMIPKEIVRVANFKPKELKNSRMFLNMADYNRMEGCDLIANYFDNMAVVESATSMGRQGFVVTSIMTQRRIVQRQSGKGKNSKDYMRPDKGGDKH